MSSIANWFRNLERPGKIAVVVGLAVVLVGGGLAAGGVFSGEDETTTTTGPTTTTAPPPPAPLTGMPTDPDHDLWDRPAISVKIGNNPEARPQAGLDVADVVFEEEVEGRITRFLAVFHSEVPDRVGPIRSVRLMDAHLVQPIGGLFVYSGGANVPERISRLDASGLEHLEENRLAGIDAQVLDPEHGNGVRPNILFADTEKLYAGTESSEVPNPIFQYLDPKEEFTAGTPIGGAPGGASTTSSSSTSTTEEERKPSLTIPVGTGIYMPTWTWDEDDGVFLRSYGEEPFLAKGDEQVTATNVVVQYVERNGEDATLVGTGKAAVLSNGRLVCGTWRRGTLDQPTQFFDAANQEIRLTPGNTWVALPLAGGALEGCA